MGGDVVSYFTEPHRGWGTFNPWYDKTFYMGMIAQVLALPGLIGFVFVSFIAWHRHHRSKRLHISCAAFFSAINGIFFVHWAIIGMFVTAGLITGTIYIYTLTYLEKWLEINLR